MSTALEVIPVEGIDLEGSPPCDWNVLCGEEYLPCRRFSAYRVITLCRSCGTRRINFTCESCHHILVTRKMGGCGQCRSFLPGAQQYL